MPAPKKHGPGVKNKGKGRPKSREPGSGDDGEELLAYHHEATARSRGQDSTPKKRADRYRGSASASLSSPSASRSRSRNGARGRPAKNDSGPLTPNTLKEYRPASMSSLRHKRKISDIRSRAASKRYIVDDENNDNNAGPDV